MVLAKKVNFDAWYDVIVVGFGGAGATAARFAADNGANVLLIDSAPEGKEGGNTRLSDQIVGAGDDYEGLLQYHKDMAAPLEVDVKVLETFTRGLVDMKNYFRKYLDSEPVSFKERVRGTAAYDYAVEYPELPDAETYDPILVHAGEGDAALWKILRQKIIERFDKIDVWYEAPARHMILSDNQAAVGMQIEKEGVYYNIGATNGVVLASGGFENSEEKIRDYLQEPYLSPIGTLYNYGAGIDLGLEAGASLWHMRSYESLGQLHGMSVRKEKGQRSEHALSVFWKAVCQGSTLTVGDDGTRYFNEDDLNRHGHIYNHGFWRVPLSQIEPYLICDKKQYDKIADKNDPFYVPGFLDNAVKANSIKSLAEKIGKKPEILARTVEEFNTCAQRGVDYAFHRSPETMSPLDENGPYYAVALRQNMLNTQGGPRRNENSEVLSPDKKPIPHLYGAGELGAPFANEYTSGGNLADCLISGKIAGENAAQEKTDDVEKLTKSSERKSVPGSDIREEKFETGTNQFIGKSTQGMGNELVVRVTIGNDQAIQKIEILKSSETETGNQSLTQLPQEMIDRNTYNVDAVSGASATSWALKDAVKEAVEKAKNK